jgi:hypothetical protein
MSRPLFLTGLARGGTNLLARMLIAGSAGHIAIHAFQPWFKSLRNALVSRDGGSEIRKAFDPNSSFGDGYFDDTQFAVLTLLRGAMLEVPFAADEWPDLFRQMERRAAEDAADLCPALGRLADAADYREMLDRILALILETRGRDAANVGLIDTWIIDLLPALARRYPEARFLIVIRDPRAIAASQLKFAEKDPSSAGHILSIVRQWRKYVALSYDFLHDPLFAGRLKLVRFEDQVSTPDKFAKDLCGFLDVPFRAEMTDFAAYEDAANRQEWRGNSAFDQQLGRIDPRVAERWRYTLAPEALAAIEVCAGMDMALCGYAPLHPVDTLTKQPGALAFLIADGKRLCSWRTDTGDAQFEYARELARYALLSGTVHRSDREIQLAFLSKSYFDLLSRRGRLFPPA